MNDAILCRIQKDECQVLGYLMFPKCGFHACTIELPWRDNEQSVSCIPHGSYMCESRHSSRYGEHFHITGVPGRSLILFHHGNYFRNTQGCVLVGDDHRDIDGDGFADVTNSRKTMEKMVATVPTQFMLDVVWSLRDA